MIFTFKNIGVVANAQIEIKGLTVITGLNDTGKSFISKSIYSTFLTLKEGSDQWFQIKLSRQIDPLIRNINVLLQGTPIPIFFNSITNFRNQIVNSFISKLPLESINPIIDSKKTELFNILQNAPNISSEIKEQVTKKLDVLFQLLQSEEGEEDKYISFFDEIIVKPLFRGQINTLYPDHEKLEIIGKEGDVEVFNIEIENNKTTRFKANNQQYYTDASLIDTPMLIHFQNIIISFGLRQSVALRGDVGVPNYYFDLANKIRPLQPVPPQLLDIYESIQKIINGKMIFNVEKNNYIYEKDNGHRIESNNTASGVKSFGLIQLLLNAGMINSKSILIIDEPEVHLHPDWQVKYAEIIVLLAQQGIPIVISTHSPYIINGIETYSNKYKIKESKVKFYFAERKESNLIDFVDKSNDVQPIYDALAKPLQKLAFQ